MQLVSVRIRPGSRTALRASRRGGSFGPSLSRFTVRPSSGRSIIGTATTRPSRVAASALAAAAHRRPCHSPATLPDNSGLVATPGLDEGGEAAFAARVWECRVFLFPVRVPPSLQSGGSPRLGSAASPLAGRRLRGAPCLSLAAPSPRGETEAARPSAVPSQLKIPDSVPEIPVSGQNTS